MSENVIVIKSKSHFDEVIEKGVVLTDFWAPWCGPCRGQLPIIEALAKEYDGKAKIAKINVDEEAVLGCCSTNLIASVPTLILFKDGTVVERFVGVQAKDILAASIDKAIGLNS